MENKRNLTQSSNGRHTILIADDLQMNREIMKGILGADYNIEEASNGVEALAMIRERGERYSLIILDNHMEPMDGLEVLEALSQNPWLKRIPVIMTSVDRNASFVDKAYSCGVADFVFIPFVPEIVRHRVKYTLDSYQRHREELINSVHIAGGFCFVMM